MTLSLNSRCVGNVTVIDCSGRIIEGPETASLERAINEALPVAPYFVLQLKDIEFIDSGGIGLIVRLLNQSRHAGGDLKLCAVSAKIGEVLRVTRLASIFDRHETDADAVAAFYDRAAARSAADPGRRPTILCADRSPNVVAYVRELLRQSGYDVITTTNVADALTLVRATKPRVLMIGRSLKQGLAADVLNRVAGQLALVEVPDNFGAGDAGEMGGLLLEQVGRLLQT